MSSHQLRGLNLEIFLRPDQYSEPIPITKIVADPKVDRSGVERYIQKLEAGEHLRAIVVVKHPQRHLYAVVDGHHRFFAQLEYGQKTIDCAVLQDFTGFMFALTQEGWLQPHPAFTKHVRAPFLKLQQTIQTQVEQGLKQYLIEFQKNPDKVKTALKRWVLKEQQST